MRSGGGQLTAYAILLPLESADSWVPCPRFVTGAAARMRSLTMEAMIVTDADKEAGESG